LTSLLNTNFSEGINGVLKLKATKLIQSWIKFGTNVLTNKTIFNLLIKILNVDSIEVIQDVIDNILIKINLLDLLRVIYAIKTVFYLRKI